jgi:hypothetical protein
MTESDSLDSIRAYNRDISDVCLEDQDLVGAANAEALSAISYLLQAGDQYDEEDTTPSSHKNRRQAMRYGVGRLLESINLYARSDEDSQARYLSDIVEDALKRIEAGEDRPAVLGLCHEWRGDVRTMIEPEAAAQHYQRARELYEPLDIDADYTGWGSEPEFTVSFRAYEHYITTVGFDEMYEAAEKPLEVQFLKRIDFKLDVVEQLTTD